MASVGGGEGSNNRRRRLAGAPRTRSNNNGPMPVIVCALRAPGAPLLPPPPAAPAPAPAPVAFGSVALSGRMRQMEDFVALRPGLCVWADGSPVHFFAVFDGHGGPHVAEMCKVEMPAALEEELALAAALLQEQPTLSDEADAWSGALRRAFERVDALGASCCQCGNVGPPLCHCGLRGGVVGSTAVVALLVRDQIIVASSGDSRAVISRDGGRDVEALSTDHKPDRPDEMQRITEAGGRVIFHNGAPRVRGILAMSRAIGHRILKPEVICDPEIKMTTRTEGDDCLILASDGVWDVVSNQMACDVVRQCLDDGTPPDLHLPAAPAPAERQQQQQQSSRRCDLAAAALGRLALGRESSDNISAVVIDLKMRE